MIDVAILQMCAPQIAPQTLQQIINVESKGNYLALNVNKLKGKQPQAKTINEAIEHIKNYTKKGYSIDVGLMQINSNNFGTYSIDQTNLKNLFDACTNIKIGAAILLDAWKRNNNTKDEQIRLQKALSIYNTGNKTAGFSNGYVKKFYKNTASSGIGKSNIYSTETSINFNKGDFYERRTK